MAKAASKAAAPRGSEAMLESWYGKKAQISAADLKAMVALTRQQGFKIIDWWVLGQPHPEVVYGTIQVDVAGTGGLVQDILKLKGVRTRLKIFPYGIPVPDFVHVRFEASGDIRR